MYAEMKGLAYQQIEEISKQENLTLHSDGTTKFDQHYMDLFKFLPKEPSIH